MLIYKYLDEKGAFETIKDNSVLLRKPIEFNDPFDCLFWTSEEEKDRAYKLFINYQLFKTFYQEMFVEKKKALRLKTLSSTFKENIKRESQVIKKNKKYELQPYLSAYYAFASKWLKKKDTTLKAQFKKMINNVLIKMRSIVLVSCFGSSYDSVLMWSHYADKHGGACVEFEIDDSAFKTVDYSKTLPPFNLYQTLKIIFGCEFANEEVDADNENNQFILSPILTKSFDWQYEKERRCIFSNKKRDSRIKAITKDGKKLILLDMPPIKNIYLGCNASKRFINKIRRIKRDAQLYKMSTLEDKYGLIAKHF